MGSPLQGALCPTPPSSSVYLREMDLSGNICSTCCTVFPRAVLSPIDKEEEEELVALVLGASKSKSKLLTCHLYDPAVHLRPLRQGGAGQHRQAASGARGATGGLETGRLETGGLETGGEGVA